MGGYNETNSNECRKRCIVFFSEFVNRISELYPEIYAGGTSEGKVASNYFEKWGWYATIDELAKGNLLKYEKVLKLNVHKIHLYLSHKIDKQKLKAELMRPKNEIQL